MAVAAWRHAPSFSDAERAALALGEAATRLADRDDAVPDAIWSEAARSHEDETHACVVRFEDPAANHVSLFRR